MCKKFRLTRVVAAFLVAMFLVSPGYGSERETIPPDPYAPIYMDWYADDERVAFIFYRPPDCVPETFDLFVFFDIPGAFFCTPLTVEGFVIYKDNIGSRRK